MESRLILVCLGFLGMSASADSSRVTSAIWGKRGERWDRARIPDVTRSGYRNGRVPPPRYSKQINVKSLGAVGDGVADDTPAFASALQNCKDGTTLYVSAGVFKIGQALRVKGARCAIRGAGQEKTTLFFEKGLEELAPRYSNGQTPWSWSGALLTFDGVKESGIEELAVRFPDNVWEGHNFHERGYNAIGFDGGAADCWLKNVTITGPDLGIWIAKTAHNITADHWVVQFGPKRGAQEISCHHAINVYGGSNLLSNFRIAGVCQHDLSVESGSSHHNVFSKGSGRNLSFDHHSQDYEQRFNLFTEIDIGEGTRMYKSGGNQTPRGVSFHETWWNIRSSSPVPWVTSMGPSKNNVIVGVNTRLPSALGDADGNWFEAVSPDAIEPRNLYEAELEVVAQ